MAMHVLTQPCISRLHLPSSVRVLGAWLAALPGDGSVLAEPSFVVAGPTLSFLLAGSSRCVLAKGGFRNSFRRSIVHRLQPRASILRTCAEKYGHVMRCCLRAASCTPPTAHMVHWDG
jgi:hypothetical protein